MTSDRRQLAKSSDRARSRRAKRASAITGLSLIGLALVSQVPAYAQRGDEAGSRAAYVRDYEAGIRSTQLSELDTAYFLAALRGEVAPAGAGTQRDDVQTLANMPSLQTISQKLGQLRDLARELQRRYRLQRPRSVGGDYIHVNDPDVPAAPVDPTISSWRSIENAVSTAPAVLIGQSRSSARPSAVPRRWRQPIRIASTGNAEYDAVAADVVRELRRGNPRLPIDDRSFPAPIGEANVFLDWRGLQCPEGSACRSFDTAPALRAASRRYEPRSAQSAMLQALAVFDQLRSGRWVPGSEIVPLDAYAGLHVTAAWLRIGEGGAINAAVCTNVTGPGTDGWGRNDEAAPSGRTRATAEEIRGSIRACLGAAMGAPSRAPRWSVRMVPVYRMAGSTQPTTYTQENMLAQIYR